MISEESCNTVDGTNGCWKFSFAITRISYIFKYIQIEKNNMVRILYINITVFLDQINAALVRIRDLQIFFFYIINPNLWTLV